MAEGMAFDLVTGVLGKLASALWDEIGLLRSFKDDAKDLRSNFSAIQAVLLDAEERSRAEIEETHALRIWLGKLKDAAYDADDLMDLIRTEAVLRKQQRELQNQNQPAEKVRGFLSHANPKHLKFKHKMAHRMKELRKKIDKIAKQRHDFDLVEAGPRSQTEFKRPETTISVVDEKEIVGRDDDKEEIVKLLLESNGHHDLSVIPIVGLGGLGKTTLAQLAFNDGRVTGEQRFDLRVWVCVSTDFDMKTIAKAVTYVAQKKCVELDNPEAVARYLVEIFSQHRFLLVLDDVWNEDPGKWKKLKVIFKDGKKGSKILVTTRSKKVAEVMKTTEQPHILKGLSEGDCWELFRRLAFKEGEENGYPSLVSIGKQIVKKCGGVPLAANALGSMMRFKSRTEDAWSAIRDSQIWRLEEEKKILSLLKWSYIQMPSALKRCFAYCSIFPKDYEIYRDDLIQQWIALGFISSHETSSSMEDIGNDYFNDLLWMSFLQNMGETYRGGVTCRMHDLVHDLAQSVASKEVAVIVGEESTRILEGCRYASICDRSMPQVPTAEVRRLRALRFRESASLTTFYSEAKCLRLLDLHDSKISMLPSSIGELKLLRYLNLSGTNIQELPESITGLCNLQTLNLSDCPEIRTLPKSLGSLANLRILNLSDCRSLTLLDSISNLLNLYKLNLRFCRELRSLEPICHLKNLHDLNLSHLENLQALPESIGNLKNLRILNLSDCRSLLSLPSSSSDLQHLEKLDISYCCQLCVLPKMIENLTKLRELLNEDCLELKGMPRGIGKLVSLRELSLFVIGKQNHVEHCASISELEHLKLVGELEIKGLENVTNPVDAKAANLIKKNLRSLKLKWNVLGAAEDMDAMLENLQPHQNLAKLEIEGYAGGKFPSWMMNRIDSCLPNLVNIELVNIPRCSSLPPLGQLPLLEGLTIRNMPAITNLGVEFDGDSHINESANKFPALRRLELSDMPRCSSLPPLGLLPVLEELIIRDMPTITNLGVEFDGDSNINESANKFPALRRLELSDMPVLREWVPVDDEEGRRERVPIFPCLTKLTLEKCPQLRASVESSRSLTALESLTIKDCDDLERIEDWLGELTKMKDLNIDGCNSLRYLPVHKMTALTFLFIMNCRDLERIEDRLGVLTKLDKLSIKGCRSLRWYLPVHKMTTLRLLSIDDCPLLFNEGGDVRVNERPEPCLPSSVQRLEISRMSKEFLSLILKRSTMDSETPSDDGDAVSLQQTNMKLQHLTIENCQQLTCLPEGLQSFTSLQGLTIRFCEDLERIEDGLRELTKLYHLNIKGCRSLRYLPVHKMTTLRLLSIEDCPLLFNAGGDVRVNERPESCLPSSVQRLEIFRMSKEFLSLILKRSTMDSEMPSDDGDAVSLQQTNMKLQRLTIGNCQQLTCLPEGLRSFTSLLELTIEDCEDLERIEDWIGELTKLKNLKICRCHNLHYLPAHKMASLKRLSIWDCPRLFNEDRQFVVDHSEDVEVNFSDLRGRYFSLERHVELESNIFRSHG